MLVALVKTDTRNAGKLCDVKGFDTGRRHPVGTAWACAVSGERGTVTAYSGMQWSHATTI